jgi:hypothetical protein
MCGKPRLFAAVDNMHDKIAVHAVIKCDTCSVVL